MGPATANNALNDANSNEPPSPELRKGDDGVIEIWLDGRFVGGIEPEPGGFRIILGDADPGSALTMAWTGGPCSFRVALGDGDFL